MFILYLLKASVLEWNGVSLVLPRWVCSSVPPWTSRSGRSFPPLNRVCTCPTPWQRPLRSSLQMYVCVYSLYARAVCMYVCMCDSPSCCIWYGNTSRHGISCSGRTEDIQSSFNFCYTSIIHPMVYSLSKSCSRYSLTFIWNDLPLLSQQWMPSTIDSPSDVLRPTLSSREQISFRPPACLPERPHCSAENLGNALWAGTKKRECSIILAGISSILRSRNVVWECRWIRVQRS